jgi:hypothetical protein
MSHTHIRAPKPEPAKVRPLHLALICAPIMLLCACLPILWNHFGASVPQNNYATADGTIVETRVAIDRIADSAVGGGIAYRLDAHVKFSAGREDQDRWPRVEIGTSSRAELMAKAKTCLVYWTPGHLENAKCKMDLY